MLNRVSRRRRLRRSAPTWEANVAVVVFIVLTVVIFVVLAAVTKAVERL
ncbi:MAG: hypothetical protein FWE39_12615 [Nocardiaceae bacterium]|nr:hypothetical protein [Nocardiaceae bacterium]